ncbi:MAG: BPSL0067 family protein [Massilia sp.]
MTFIYANANALKDMDKVGSHHCVALVQYYANLPHTSRWKQGEDVLGNHTLVLGTAIATFINGRYPSNPHGNHAAFFLRHAPDGFWVIDQWKDKPGGEVRPISERLIKCLHRKQKKNGSWPAASDNADAYSVIET